MNCNTNVEKMGDCIYTKFSLFNTDSLLVSFDYKNDTLEAFDKIGILKNYSKGLYRFDKNNNLRFYGFYVNDSNFKYSEEYDEFGNLIYFQGSTLLEFRILNKKNDTCQFNVFLSSLQKKYLDIIIVLNRRDTLTPDFLFKSTLYSNVKCFSFSYKAKPQVKELELITKMSFVNNCSKKQYTLYDTAIVPISKIIRK
jgi:hypothetical protein